VALNEFNIKYHVCAGSFFKGKKGEILVSRKTDGVKSKKYFSDSNFDSI